MALRYAILIDLDRCIGCQACAVACRTGNTVPPETAYITVTDVVRREGPGMLGSFAHHRCFHCGAAPCVSACPTGTLSKWNGLTAITAERCSGCGYCTDACPFQVPQVVEGRVAKCSACLDQVKDRQAPWCMQTCPSQAIRFGDRDDLLDEAKARVARLKPRYPNAQVYGETQLGGLGLLLVLVDRPETYGLPVKPDPPATLAAWQGVVRPAATGISAAAVLGMGLLFVVARRQHAQEKAQAKEEPKGEAAAIAAAESALRGEDHQHG